MKVKAIKRGFYGSLREPGDTFDIEGEEQFSEVWMERVKRGRQPKEKPAEKSDE